MTQPTSIDEIMDEWGARPSDFDPIEEGKWLRSKLTTLVEQAKGEAYMDALILVDRHDPNIGMGRETSTLYWGNTLRNALLALIRDSAARTISGDKK